MSKLPANLSRMLGKEHQKTDQDIIIDFLLSEYGAVTLTDNQKQMLDRWEQADDLMREGRMSSQDIAKLLQKKYKISLRTAIKDLDSACLVFASTRKKNKAYLVANHVDRIDKLIIEYKKQGKPVEKLVDSYTKALALMPEEKDGDIRPTAIIFNVSQTNIEQVIAEKLSLEEMGETAAKKLRSLGLIEEAEILEDDQ